MEPKKNPKAELKRNSTLFFMIGLTAVLCMSYTVIEWKTYEKRTPYDPELDIPDPYDEELPPIIPKKELPKPKIKTPPIIEIAEDDENLIETPIESSEPNQDAEVVNYEDIDYEEVPVEEKIDWVNIEEVPIYPGCENSTDKRACFQEMMLKHIRKNFRYPEAAIETNQQGKVYVQFTVQKDGGIAEVKLRGPHKTLVNEAARIISKLPKMTPGKQRGTPVKVPFSIPITFQLQ